MAEWKIPINATFGTDRGMLHATMGKGVHQGTVPRLTFTYNTDTVAIEGTATTPDELRSALIKMLYFLDPANKN